MPLFQHSILKKHVESFDVKHIEERWQLFKSIFHTAEKQKNIRNSKEEQYQEGFLRDLFVTVLGYTINPEPNFNLLTEQRNVNNSKKADGAILIDGKAIGVIELKGTETTDLNKIEIQAFGYKNNQPGCNYVITSNFEKLRFYIDNTTQQEEFNLFTLTKAQFETLYACLAWESIARNMPMQLLNESVSKENNITKSLYKDYSEFKRALFANMVELNPHFDKLVLFKKTQKLLDRFLFIFFAEDRGLLPTNLIFRINQEWKNLQAMRIPVSLYERYMMYFNDLNHGAKVSLPAFGKKTGEAITQEFEIFAYNGGLFVPDEILDNIKIDDTLLHLHTEKMSHYNFESDVDVNILGHIFENSLNEIDEIKSEIEGNVLEKTKTRRKKDGVFYTPKYITKYIVDNTVGKLCAEKKEELKLNDEDFTSTSSVTGSSGHSKAKKKNLLDKLNDYRNWLLDLTICDPACGSGAFLNQALEFLIAEHRYVDELQAKLLGESLILSDIENSILERNIYGVDLNDESVEIAKLSLWLRTAQKGRKLNSLNNNIKCGNSLIDDPAVAGDKAFSWEKEFPEVFAEKVSADGTLVKSGGFDVVIGNPPYLRVQGIKENHKVESLFIESKYTSATGRYDLYILFIEKSTKIINKEGKVSFILPHNFITGKLGSGIRKLLSQDGLIEEILHFGSHLVFSDASTYTCILGLSRENKKIRYASINPEFIFNSIKFDNIEYSQVSSDNWQLNNTSHQAVLDKLNKNELNVANFFSDVARGIVSGSDDIFILKGEITGNTFRGYSKELDSEIEIESALVRPILMGNSASRYQKLQNEKYIIYPHIRSEGKTEIITENALKTLYPLTFSYLSNFKEKLTEKKIKYKTNPVFWYGLHNSRDLNIFECKKIVTPYLANICQMTIDDSDCFITNDKCSVLILKPKYQYQYEFFLGILNSKLMWFFISKTSSEFSGGYFAFTNLFINPFPLPDAQKEEIEVLSNLVNNQLTNSENHQIINKKFVNYLHSQYQIEKLSGKLEKWYELEFVDFIKELNKAIKAAKGSPLTKKDEFEWMELFEENKKKALELKAEIDKTDKEIDRMVYELYGLTEEEIKIVEGV